MHGPVCFCVEQAVQHWSFLLFFHNSPFQGLLQVALFPFRYISHISANLPLFCSGFITHPFQKEKRPSPLVFSSIMKPHLPPLCRFGSLTLLLCSCQAKPRMKTWRLSCMHTPFYFQIPKNFTRFPGSHPSKAQHGQEVGRQKRTEINFLKPALLFSGWSNPGLQEHLEVPEKESEVTPSEGRQSSSADTCTQWLLTCWSMKGSALSIPGFLETNLCSHSDKLIMQMFCSRTRLRVAS